MQRDIKTTYRCEHWHINSIRMIQIQHIRVGQCKFLRTKVFIETVLQKIDIVRERGER